MIDYDAFHNYLTELVGLYQRQRSLKGMSDISRKWHCAGLIKEQFFQMKLDKLQPAQVTQQLSRVIRDTIGKSEAKAALRESIGALNEGILANSRISQGSDRTVQITITQPVQPAAAAPHPQSGRQQVKQESPNPTLPNYRVGQVLYHKTADELFIVSRLLDNDRFAVNYSLASPKYARQVVFDSEYQTFWLGNENIRPAKGSEIARYLGALTQSGFEWEADNVNGLFFVKGRKQERTESVEVFANDLPGGYHGIYALPSYQPSPYRFALRCACRVDNAEQFMCQSSQPPVVRNAVLRQLEAVGNLHGCDGIREFLEYDVPTLCCAETLREHRVAFVKVNGSGASYWLARDRDVLRLLAWISFIV